MTKIPILSLLSVDEGMKWNSHTFLLEENFVPLIWKTVRLFLIKLVYTYHKNQKSEVFTQRYEYCIHSNIPCE